MLKSADEVLPDSQRFLTDAGSVAQPQPGEFPPVLPSQCLGQGVGDVRSQAHG